MNHSKWVLQKYPVSICGLRDDLSGDMLTSSQRNFVPLVLAPPTKNCFLHPWESVSIYITTETHRERTETKVKKPWFEGSNIYKQIITSQIQMVLWHCQVMPHRLWRIPKLYFPLSLLKVFLTPDSGQCRYAIPDPNCTGRLLSTLLGYTNQVPKHF